MITIFLVMLLYGCKYEGSAPQDVGLKNKSERVEQAFNDIKQQKIGAVGWQAIFSGNNTIVNNGGGYLVSYRNKENFFQTENVLNLKDIDASHVQGDICTNFLFNKDGSRVIINNTDTNTNKKYNVYYFDMLEDELKILSQFNSIASKGAWSQNSIYFALADVGRIIIYNTKTNNIRDIPIKYGEVSGIFVLDNGDILLQTNDIYLLTSKANYNGEILHIDGKLLSFAGSGIIYFSGGDIYCYGNENQPTKINSIGVSYNLCGLDSMRAIFSDDKNTVVYDIDKNQAYSFDFNYNEFDRPKFSPDSQRCIVKENGFLKVESFIGATQIIEKIESSAFDSEYCWLNENTLVKTVQKDHSMMLGDFSLKRKVLD